MHGMRVLLLSIISSLLFSIAGYSQATNSANVGLPPNATFEGSAIESVQVNNGNLHIEIPLFTLPGRGLPVTVSYVYDSKGWKFKPAFAGANYQIQPAAADGIGITNQQWRVAAPLSGKFSHPQGTKWTKCANGVYQILVTYTYQDDSGTGHTFPTIPQPHPCIGTDYTGTMIYATDGSGYGLMVGAVEPPDIFRKDGTKISLNVIEDSNGNQIQRLDANTITDTLGRSVQTALVLNSSTGRYELPYYDSDGVSHKIEVVKSPIAIQTHLCTGLSFTSCTEYSATWNLPTEIDLPNGMKYTISYVPNSYGQPSAITLPTGATISYGWGTGTVPHNAVAGTPYDTDPAGPRVTSRTVSVSGQSSAWEYQYVWASPDASGRMLDQTIVTDPLQNETVHQFELWPDDAPPGNAEYDDPSWLWPPSYENKTLYYSGSHQGGTLLKTIDTVYQTRDQGPRLPTAVTTTWNKDGNIASRVETDWDRIVNPVPGGVAGTFSYVGWGNPVEKREYGFDGTLVRKTQFNYAHLAGNTNFDPNYLAANLGVLLTEKKVLDGTGAVLSDTKNYYDQATLIPDPGVPTGTHDYSARTYRGNLTRTSVWLDRTGSWLNTDNTYDELGHLRTTTDPGLHTTNYTYDDLWASTTGNSCVGTHTQAYLTSTCAPDTNGIHHCVKASYYRCTGRQRATADQNDINAGREGTTHTYDLLNRSLCDTKVDGGQVCYSYVDVPNAISVTKTEKLDATHNVQSISYHDGLGRVTQTQLRDPKDGDSYVDTTYDLLGRISTVSNPHRTSPSSTDGTTHQYYDELGRKIKEVPPDGSDLSNNVRTDYGGSAIGLITTVTDQAGNQRRSYADALGRLVRVDEPALNGIIPAISATGSVTLGGSERSVQISGTPGTAGSGTVTISGSLRYTTTCANSPSAQVAGAGTVDPNLVCTRLYDTGTVSITVNGRTKSVNYASGLNTTSGAIANALAALFNQDTTAYVTASISGTVITLTARTAGASTNYPLSTSVVSDQNSFTATRGSATLLGGTDGVAARTEWDIGTVSVTLNGLSKSRTYGQTSTTIGLASLLAGDFNADGSSCATANAVSTGTGARIDFTARAAGAAANSCALSATSATTDTGYFSGTSFPVSYAGLSGGQDASQPIDRPAVTEYKYDTLDRLTCVVQRGSDPAQFTTCDVAPATWRPRKFTYDSLSRLLTARNPESGTITWTYDNDSNVLTKTDARYTINYSPSESPIDALHRVTKKTYSNGDPAVSYFYDQTSYNGQTIAEGVGQRTGMSDATGQAAWSFDTEGRVVLETKTVNIAGLTPAPVTKTLNYAYYLNGSLRSVTYPSGHRVDYDDTVSGNSTSAGNTYSAVDQASGINYVINAAYAPHGETSGYTNGQTGAFAGIVATNVWNNRFQPQSFTAETQGSGGHTVQSLTFSFNQGTPSAPIDSGLLMKVSNNLRPDRSTNYTYDALNRITAAWHDGTDWGTSYAVDVWGNLYQKGACTGTPCPARVNHDSLPPGIIANTSNRLDSTSDPYSYDASGNLLNDKAGHVFVYDAENRPASVTTIGSTYYYYDGDGERVAKSNGKLYLFGTNSAPVVETDASGNITAEYIFFNGKRVAMRKPDNSVHYYFADQVGSATTVTSATGSTEQEIEYRPYGEQVVISDTLGQEYRFTGKEHDEESGNDYFGARYYSATWGRFLTHDPEQAAGFGHMADPQAWNGYAYVRNTPSFLVDADGTDYNVCGPDGKNCHNYSDTEYQQWLKDNPGVRQSPTGQLQSCGSGGCVNIGTATYNTARADLQAAAFIGSGQDFVNAFMFRAVRDGATGGVLGYAAGEFFGGVVEGLSGARSLGSAASELMAARPAWANTPGGFVNWLKNLQRANKTLTAEEADAVVAEAKSLGVDVRLDPPHPSRPNWNVPHLNIGKEGQAHLRVPDGYQNPSVSAGH